MSVKLLSLRVLNPIGCVMVSMLTSSAVSCVFEQRMGQTKGYDITIWCFFSKHESLRSKTKDWLAQNQDNISEWSDKSIHELLF
jgi:hypothetical protein